VCDLRQGLSSALFAINDECSFFSVLLWVTLFEGNETSNLELRFPCLLTMAPPAPIKYSSAN